MSLKVYLAYDGEPKTDVPITGDRLQREEYKLKTTLPEKWGPEPCQKVLNLFVTNYNKKFPDKPIQGPDMRLKIGGIYLDLDGKITDQIRDYADVKVEHKEPEKKSAGKPPGSLTCTNYGCGQYYFEADNTEGSCKHHRGGPVFHDTVKFWSCCEAHKAYDFDDFQAIPTCSTGRHTSEEKRLFCKPVSQTVDNIALTPAQIETQKAQGVTMLVDDGVRRTGPREFEGARQAQKIVDGMATCRNFGCGIKFKVDENTDETACVYHKGGPVFWDTYKYWSCCPEQKKYEFDDFAAVVGCMRGIHQL